jgi:hypothetical protein
MKHTLVSIYFKYKAILESVTTHIREAKTPKTIHARLATLLVQRCNGTTTGLGYLEVTVIVYSNLPIGRLTSVRTDDPHWGESSILLLTLTLTTITSMQILNKQASRPLHVHTTMQPPVNITTYNKFTRLNTNL